MATPQPRTNLPLQTTSFIGREAQVEELTRLLSNTRLLTLTGSGGVGKTRLAIEVASSVARRFTDGVWLVELAPLSDAALVPNVVASTLGLGEQFGRPVSETLADYLRDLQALIVLDNCEHLVASCAELVNALLRVCPEVCVLATSREPLGVPGESDWRVSTLELPESPVSNLNQLAERESIRLFVERAKSALPSFSLTETNAPAVIQICRRLDGIPLAIELAAARVKFLSVEQIDRRLDDAYGLLGAGRRTAPARQQTLRGLVDWSYGLLSEPERQLFGRLSAFAGSWSLEAAESIGTGGRVAADDVLGLLGNLVDKSLVLAEQSGPVVRYRLLETIRQYAAERLRESGSELELRARHTDWFLRLAEESEEALHGPAARGALDALAVEHDNLRAALEWSRRESSTPGSMLRLVAALASYWMIRGHAREARTWIEEALEDLEAPLELQLRALITAVPLAINSLDPEIATPLAERGLAIAEELEDEEATVQLLSSLAVARYNLGDFTSAVDLAQRGLRLAESLENPRLIGRGMQALGIALHGQGDVPSARDLYEKVLSVRRKSQDLVGMTGVLHLIAMASHELGDRDRARAEYTESLELSNEIGYHRNVAQAIAGLAALVDPKDQGEQAVRLGAAAHALAEKIGVPVMPRLNRLVESALAQARRALPEAAYAVAWQAGRALSEREAISEALGTDSVTKGTGPQPTPSDTGRHPLSSREVEVIRLLAMGHTSKEIAAKLVVSISTVDRHITHIYSKIGGHRRADAAAFAVANGLAQPRT